MAIFIFMGFQWTFALVSDPSKSIDKIKNAPIDSSFFVLKGWNAFRPSESPWTKHFAKVNKKSNPTCSMWPLFTSPPLGQAFAKVNKKVNPTCSMWPPLHISSFLFQCATFLQYKSNSRLGASFKFKVRVDWPAHH